ncbi:hypothetical protein HZI73_11075 [Vallitalea pronyensis]|uniref:Uncharacterized protein n=1 Tax=Vallitalea pronyensis TaxID=1348613 RepID=A0A8J8SGN6_9FIRM|nr:hypothetical protein [Vallitalea pronyensis]QUI22796.1 hypothetical protein HZI73_11075 [Vallitalea pronyensis]
MKMLLNVNNGVNIARYMVKDGLSTNSIIRVDLGLVGQDGNESFFANMYTVQHMFRELVGRFWDERTLAYWRSNPKNPPMPVAKTRFNPTLQNVAKAIFLRMKPFIDARFADADLAYVMVFTPMGKAKYYDEELLFD